MIPSGCFADCSSLKELTYLGDAKVSNDIGLHDGVEVHVNRSYPYDLFGGRPVTRPRSESNSLSGGAIAGITISGVVLIAIAYYFLFSRTSLMNPEKL